MVEASRKYDVLVQVGHNNRSTKTVREAIKFLHDGGIGEVYMARGLCFKARDSYGLQKIQHLLHPSIMKGGWDLLSGVLITQNGAITAGTGIGIQETEIQVTRVRTSSILPAGD